MCGISRATNGETHISSTWEIPDDELARCRELARRGREPAGPVAVGRDPAGPRTANPAPPVA